MQERHERRTAVEIESSGHRLIGVLHRPLVDHPVPAVLIIHGFAGNKLGHQRIYVACAAALSAQGVAVLRVDCRGCGDSEGSFEHNSIDTLVTDACESVRFLRSQPGIDGDRIGVLGASLGGAISVLLAMQLGDISALAMWAPVADGQLWQQDWETNYPAQTLAGHIVCNGVKAGPLFQEQFLDIQADRMLAGVADVPLFHAHGERDDIVCFGHADAYRLAREGCTTLTRFIVLPNSNHFFTHPEERELLLNETTHWFTRTLGVASDA